MTVWKRRMYNSFPSCLAFMFNLLNEYLRPWWRRLCHLILLPIFSLLSSSRVVWLSCSNTVTILFKLMIVCFPSLAVLRSVTNFTFSRASLPYPLHLLCLSSLPFNSETHNLLFVKNSKPSFFFWSLLLSTHHVGCSDFSFLFVTSNH